MPNPLKKAAKFENKMINKLEKAEKKDMKMGTKYEPKVKAKQIGAKKK